MNKPQWLNNEEYPFESHFINLDIGKMHYLDEGSGEPIIFIHGNPTWSFLYRKLIKTFSLTHRCIAPDHIGFGLSDKPNDWSYLPNKHAQNIDELLELLDLQNITLVVGDWGGPIGLSYATNHPENIKNIIITNTWAWSVKDDWYYQLFSKLVGGFIGRWLIRKHRFVIIKLLSTAFRNTLTADILNHYLMPLYDSKDRTGCSVFPKQVIDASKWLDLIWDRRNLLQNKNILIAWGNKDIGFRKKELDRWVKSFPMAKVVCYENVGHFVPEENTEEFINDIMRFI